MKINFLVALSFAAALPFAAAEEKKVSTQARQIPRGENHREGFDADLMHYTDQGSGFFPLSVLHSLKDSKTGKPFLENLERFGLVPGEKSARNPDGFPVGIVTNAIQTASGREIKMLGFTCAACHTSDLRYQGQTLRVDGSSGQFYVDELGDQIANSLKTTLEDPEELLAFLQRLVRNSELLGGPMRDAIEKVMSLKRGPLRRAIARELHEEVLNLLAEIKAGDETAKAPAEQEKAAPPKPLHRLRAKLEDHLEQEKTALLDSILPHLRATIAELRERRAFLKMRAWLSADPTHRLAGGYGRADDFGTARVEIYGGEDPRNMLPVDAPVSMPPLWNIDRYAWLHWNANTNSVIQRSIGEAIGVGAPLHQVNVVNQIRIEEQMHKLTAPAWPDFFGKPDKTKAAKGRELYNQNCASCHSPKTLDDKGLIEFRLLSPDQVGTDPNDAKNFDRPVYLKDGSKVSFAKAIQQFLGDLQAEAKKKMTPKETSLLDRMEAKQTPVKWRDTMTETGGPVYPAKPLEGIWATAPFLHNGSVPTLYHLLRPDERPEKFLVGQRDFDPVRVGLEIRPDKITRQPDLALFEFNASVPGNLNIGHKYGADLSDEDCEVLIEYLKVHREVWPSTHAAYLKEHQSDFDWFVNASNAYGGVPLILLRSLPDLAPEIWGKPEEQFARFGFLPNPDGPLPLGLSWDSMDLAHPPQPLHPVALSCAACHIGRVRLEDGSSQKIVGGPNTQFDVRMWRKAFETTVHQILSSPEDIKKTAGTLSKVIGEKPPNYYFRNFRGVTEQAEAGERQVVAAKAADILAGFAGKILLGELATTKQKATSYSKPNAPPLDGGSPGQSDGSGDLLPRLALLDSLASVGPAETMKTFLTTPSAALPNQLATVTDNLSTWQLWTRNIAQVDGSVKSPFFRNVAASVAIAGDPKMVNVVNADVTARFISQLPPPGYPFAVDENRAKIGEKLFRANCVQCHKPHNDIVYRTDLIGTDPNRSRVLNSAGLALFVKHFVASVPAAYESTDSSGAKYKPKELPVDSILFDRSRPENQGYVTNALEGLWARAPYLHNGSVPTLYHLLVPAERPAKFVRGSISYDTEKIGFQWDLARLEEARAVDPTAAPYDTSWDSASRLGHDTNLTIDAAGNILHKGWDDPARDGEIRVRLDWSGAENKESLGALLEYLKVVAVDTAPSKSAAPGTQLARAKEVLPEGEEEVIAELRARHLKGHQVKPGPKLRGEHPKQHAGVWATFRVEKNLAPEFRVGLFAEPRSYSALVRFSNGRGFDDNKPDVHAAAVKVLIPVAGAAEPQQQDFIVADNPVFFARDVRHLLEFLNVTERVPPVSPLTTHPLLKTFSKPATLSLLAMTYWSQTPYKLGNGAVKYMLMPSASGEERPPIPLGPSPDFLREALIEQLTFQKRGASFDLCILPQIDPVTMPIEDPTIEWTSKPVRVATVSIHPQRFDSPEQMSFFENLSWSPWNARPEHAPIGGINRARRLIYEESSAMRHKETGLAPIVPTGRESF